MPSKLNRAKIILLIFFCLLSNLSFATKITLCVSNYSGREAHFRANPIQSMYGNSGHNPVMVLDDKQTECFPNTFEGQNFIEQWLNGESHKVDSVFAVDVWDKTMANNVVYGDKYGDYYREQDFVIRPSGEFWAENKAYDASGYNNSLSTACVAAGNKFISYDQRNPNTDTMDPDTNPNNVSNPGANPKEICDELVKKYTEASKVCTDANTSSTPEVALQMYWGVVGLKSLMPLLRGCELKDQNFEDKLKAVTVNIFDSVLKPALNYKGPIPTDRSNSYFWDKHVSGGSDKYNETVICPERLQKKINPKSCREVFKEYNSNDPAESQRLYIVYMGGPDAEEYDHYTFSEGGTGLTKTKINRQSRCVFGGKNYCHPEHFFNK